MAEVIRMPRMSDTMEEGNIVEWLKNEGDTIEAGETLAEVETDKATMELDSFVDGVLLHIEVKEGPVPVDGIIAVVGKEGEDWKAALEEEQSGNGATEKEEVQAPEAREQEAKESRAEEAVKALSEKSPPEDPAGDQEDGRLKASPLARSMAREAEIDLRQIKGSGDGGRIVKRDIEAYLEQQKEQPQPAPAPQQPAEAPAPEPKKEQPAAPVTPFAFSPGEAQYEDKPLSQMRKTIARRLSESKFSAPHFYLTIEIDMAKVMGMRKRVNEVAPSKISFNDFIVKAAAMALRRHPAVNASWQDDHIRYHKDVNVGVAVAVDEGLLVPVVRYADIKTLSQINAEVKEKAGRARKRRLQPEEMQGNTFTISNLGMFGIEEFTAIINPPDSCILAVGGIVEKAVVEQGEITAGHRMKVTLSCDHRAVDGATGAQFLQSFKEMLEDPVRLLI
jgi:pyruvate dehydrogenase E2 component (dihydrolipoamide acetyltransferase)